MMHFYKVAVLNEDGYPFSDITHENEIFDFERVTHIRVPAFTAASQPHTYFFRHHADMLKFIGRRCDPCNLKTQLGIVSEDDIKEIMTVKEVEDLLGYLIPSMSKDFFEIEDNCDGRKFYFKSHSDVEEFRQYQIKRGEGDAFRVDVYPLHRRFMDFILKDVEDWLGEKIDLTPNGSKRLLTQLNNSYGGNIRCYSVYLGNNHSVVLRSIDDFKKYVVFGKDSAYFRTLEDATEFCEKCLVKPEKDTLMSRVSFMELKDALNIKQLQEITQMDFPIAKAFFPKNIRESSVTSLEREADDVIEIIIPPLEKTLSGHQYPVVTLSPKWRQKITENSIRALGVPFAISCVDDPTLIVFQNGTDAMKFIDAYPGYVDSGYVDSKLTRFKYHDLRSILSIDGFRELLGVQAYVRPSYYFSVTARDEVVIITNSYEKAMEKYNSLRNKHDAEFVVRRVDTDLDKFSDMSVKRFENTFELDVEFYR